MNKSLFINIYQALLHVAENLSTIEHSRFID